MNLIRSTGLAAILFATAANGVLAHDEADPATLAKPEIRDLMTQALEGAEGKEVILSHVALPPNMTLPMHWHPGEEFAYVLKGTVTLILDGKGEQEISQGETGVVPLKHVHTARSGPEGVSLLVFRVHVQGEPGRVLVDK